MTLLFDTNIVLDFLRNGSIISSIDDKYDLNSEKTILAISAVTIGELNALALKRNWGEKRKNKLKDDLKKFLVIPVNSKDIWAQL
jgi:predicted nucleic acid-binding protein